MSLALFSSVKRFNKIRRTIAAVTILCTAVISLSRTTAMIQNYGGQSRLWLHASTLPRGSVLCTGDAWYRFQSSFFLPQEGRLEFVREGFRGALPTHFNTTDSIPSGMNDNNKEEPSHYVPVQSCDYIVAELPSRTAETFLGAKIEVEHCWDIMNRLTPFPRRAFWIPEVPAQWSSYCLARVKVH